jgi:hypothetical protein
MTKKIILATLAIFILWSVLDFILHGMILSSAYQASAHLWRPRSEIKHVLMYCVILLSALVFVTIYARLISPKNMNYAVSFGVLFGVGAGISMGYGTYSVQPIPYVMAVSWFLGTLLEATLAGFLLGWLVKEEKLKTS